jgi:hypothetical protein
MPCRWFETWGVGFTSRFLALVPSTVTGRYPPFYRSYGFKLCSRLHLIGPLFSCVDLVRVIPA